MRVTELVLACLGLPAALVVLPAEQVRSFDLTGEWKCNIARSTFMGQPPAAMNVKIKDSPAVIDMTFTELREGTERSFQMKLDKTGRETITKVGSTEIRTVLTSEPDRLKEHAVILFESGSRMTRRGVILLSDDKKTITKQSVYSTSQGEVKETIILERL